MLCLEKASIFGRAQLTCLAHFLHRRSRPMMMAQVHRPRRDPRAQSPPWQARPLGDPPWSVHCCKETRQRNKVGLACRNLSSWNDAGGHRPGRASFSSKKRRTRLRRTARSDTRPTHTSFRALHPRLSPQNRPPAKAGLPRGREGQWRPGLDRAAMMRRRSVSRCESEHRWQRPRRPACLTLLRTMIRRMSQVGRIQRRWSHHCLSPTGSRGGGA